MPGPGRAPRKVMKDEATAPVMLVALTPDAADSQWIVP